MPPKCRQSSLQRVERVWGAEFICQLKPSDLHLPRRWWTAKADRVLQAEEEHISKESRSDRKKESLRIEETVNLTTKSKSLLFVIMHSHRRGSTSSEGRWAYNKHDDQVWKLFKNGGALDETSLHKKDTVAFIHRLKKIGSKVSYMHYLPYDFGWLFAFCLIAHENLNVNWNPWLRIE